MYSRKLTRPIAVFAVALAIGGGAYGIVSATAGNDVVAATTASADAATASTRPTEGMLTKLDAPLAYGGYCGTAALGNVRGKVVICHGTHRAGLPGAAEREAAVKAGGGIGIMTIADPGFTVEPPRWLSTGSVDRWFGGSR